MTYGPPGSPPPDPRPTPHPRPAPAPQPEPSEPPAAARRTQLAGVHLLDWAVLAAGVLIAVFSFFDYYTYAPKGQLRTDCHSASAPKIAQRLCNGAAEGAWSGLFGWVAVLLAVVGALAVGIAVVAPRVRLPAPGRLIAVVAFGLAVLGTLLALFFVPNYVVDGAIAHGAHYGRSVTEGHGFSYWLIFALLLVGFVSAFVRWQQTGMSPSSVAPAPLPPGPRPRDYGPPPPTM